MTLVSYCKSLKPTANLVWREFNQVGCFVRAGNLAFVTLLSLVPLLTVSFTVLSAFPTFRELGHKLQQALFESFVAIPTETIRDYLQAFINQTAQLSAMGMIFLMATAVLLMFSMEQTFNAIWHTKRNRSAVTAFLLYWSVITFIPLVIATIVWLANYLIMQVNLINSNLHFITEFITLVAPYIATFIAFAVLYITLPNCKVKPKNAMIAAFIVTIMFEIARKAFAFYIVHLSVYQIIYGALAIIPVFFIWLYVSWVIILFGGVLNYALALHQQRLRH